MTAATAYRPYMRRALITALVVLMLAAGAFVASAAWPVIWGVGVIKTFDPRAGSLVVRQGRHQMTFALTPEASILDGLVRLRPTDLLKNVGRQVKVRYAIVNDVKSLTGWKWRDGRAKAQRVTAPGWPGVSWAGGPRRCCRRRESRTRRRCRRGLRRWP